MLKILGVSTMILGLVEAGFRDWMVDAALAPVVPVGKAVSKMSKPIMKKTAKGVIAYNGDMESLQRNPNPFRIGSGRKMKRELKQKRKQENQILNPPQPLTNSKSAKTFPPQNISFLPPPPPAYSFPQPLLLPPPSYPEFPSSSNNIQDKNSTTNSLLKIQQTSVSSTTSLEANQTQSVSA